MIKQNHQGQRWQNHTNSDKSKMPRSKELPPSAMDCRTPIERGWQKKMHKLEITEVDNTLTSNTKRNISIKNS